MFRFSTLLSNRPNLIELMTTMAALAVVELSPVAALLAALSGVNNHRSDAYTNATAHPSIFLIDLEARPSPSAPWREGVNFWRIELPPGSDATAPGLIQITPVQAYGSGVLDNIVAGDLQGNVWKLSFSLKGVDSLGTDGLLNLSTLNAMGSNHDPFFHRTRRRRYADMDRDMKYTAETDTLIVEEGPVGNGVMSNGDRDNDLEDWGTLAYGFLMFNPAGFPRSASDGIASGSLVFHLPEGRATAVVFSNAGRVHRCDPNKAGCRPTSWQVNEPATLARSGADAQTSRARFKTLRK